MFQTLHLIDKDYFQKFGWRQAAIWAVEEPESSLHTSLEANVGSLLSHIAKEQNGRLQILSSTHSNLIVQHADRAYFVEKHSAGSSITALQPFEIITRTANAGVSEWVHPLLYHPLEPLVIVEGKYDETFISKALRLMGKDHLCRVSYLERLTDDGSTGGIESTLKYLRSNRSAIKSRRRGAPVVMVLDWESKNRKKHFEELFTASDPFYALCWPETDCNPKLGKTFRGIERFYSDRIIRLAESTGVNISRNRGGIAVVDRDEYGDIKQAMSKVVASHLEIRDLIFAKNCLDLIVSHVLGSTSPQKV
jgi:hypothetical protein